jgi:hypothetical protein
VDKSTSVNTGENQNASVLKTAFVTPDRIRNTPAEMSWVARDFRFHTGEVVPELRLHYTTAKAAKPMSTSCPSGSPFCWRARIADRSENSAHTRTLCG